MLQGLEEICSMLQRMCAKCKPFFSAVQIPLILSSNVQRSECVRNLLSCRPAVLNGMHNSECCAQATQCSMHENYQLSGSVVSIFMVFLLFEYSMK